MTTSYQVVLFAAMIGILPITWWLWVVVKENHFGKGSLNLLVEIFFWGVLAAVPASLIEMMIAETGGGSQIVLWMQNLWLFGEVPFQFVGFLSAFLIATIEELSKLIGIIIALGRRKVESVNDGLIFGIIIGLAFAVTENGVYFSSAVQMGEVVDFGSVVLLRFVLSTSAHIIYSGVAGMFFAKTKLSKGFQRFQFALLAIFMPIIIHAFFNFLLGGPRGINSAILSVIMAIGLLMLWSEYQDNRGKKQIEVIKKRRKKKYVKK